VKKNEKNTAGLVVTPLIPEAMNGTKSETGRHRLS